MDVTSRPIRSFQYDASTVRPVMRNYLRSSGSEAETRSRSQRRHEHLGGQVLGIWLVADFPRT